MEDALVKVLEKIIAENFSEEKMALLLLKGKIKEQGIELTKHQENQLISNFRKHGLNDFTLKLTRQQKAQFGRLGKDDLILDFEETDLVAFQNEINSLSASLGVETAKWFTDKLFQDWKKQAKSILKKIKKDRNKFVDYHNKIWGSPFDLLESLISLCLEMGNDFRQRFSGDAQNENDIIFFVLERLHARGCQVSSEILTLLRGGFADGAHARWRTLHELSVVAQFIAKYDNELAERYLIHSVVADYHRAKEFREYSTDLSYAPMSDEEFDAIESSFDEALKKYGKSFKYDYGWASEVLGKTKPNFSDIEKEVYQSHMQPFVKLAHVNVHAGSAGVFIRLGSPPNDRDLLVAGASTFGVGEPGQNAAYTIFNLTSALILHKNKNLDNLILVQALRKLMEEVIQEFDRVMEKQENTK